MGDERPRHLRIEIALVSDRVREHARKVTEAGSLTAGEGTTTIDGDTINEIGIGDQGLKCIKDEIKLLFDS